MSTVAKYTYIFPGQGAQFIGMGKSFYDSYRESRDIFTEADDLLHYSLSQEIFSGDESRLKETKISQPAIFVTSIAILSALQHQFGLTNPISACGLSLGEYSALVAAKIIPFSEALSLVAKRGKYMHEACESTPGSMRVVLGLSDEAVVDAVTEIASPNEIWCANFNCPGQVVLSGTVRGLDAIEPLLKAKGAKRIVPLAVHGGFHSGLMKSAQEALKEEIMQIKFFSPSHIKLAMNYSGIFEPDITRVKDGLIQQVVAPVRWHQCIQSCVKDGTELFIEVGPGKTLAGMNKKSQISQPTISVETIHDLEAVHKIIAI